MKLEMISKYPLEKAHPTPLLFIHGALHTASCWDVHFLDYFDFVQDVVNVVQQFTTPPVLIGHSMGGFIIQKYLEDHDAPGAVLLSSPSPAGFCRSRSRMPGGIP